jgi:dipeptidyl aminopeptidase/acylaminoacyl peptidase
MLHFQGDSKRALLWLLLTCASYDSAVVAQPLPGQPLLAPLQRDGVGEPEPQVQAVLPRYLQSRSAHFIDWLSDGSLLISTRFGETAQVHRLHAPLGMREQVSFASGGIAAAIARPYASDAFIYQESLRGGQATQLFMQRLDTHELISLTDGNHRDGTPLWAHDGKHLAFASNRVNGADVGIYELDTDSPTSVPRLIAGTSGDRWQVFDWSGDDKRLLLGRSAGSSSEASAGRDVALFVVNVDSGEINALTTAETSSANAGTRGTGAKGKGARGTGASMPVLARDARFSTDGHGLLLLTEQQLPGVSAVGGASASAGGRFAQLVYMDPRTHDWRLLSTATNHDVERFDQSADGHYVAYTLNEGGADRLMLIDQTRKLDLAITQLPIGVIGNFRFDQSGQHLALSIETPRSPADVYVFEPGTHALTAWTHSESGPVNAQGFVLPETLRFPTWDRPDNGQPRELQALVYRAPPQAANAAAHPVLILICSGAGRQCRPGFDPLVQYLVIELGFDVVAPNVRGSSGMGSSLEQAGSGQLVPDAVRDVGSLLVWIGLQRELDRNRVAVLGEGFGGYLALQSLADYPDRLRGGVAAFPPHNAALAHSSAIRRPLLLVQGLNNPAAPPYELDQLRLRLRADGVEVQSLEAADEGRDFERKSNRDAYLMTAASFLAQLLR